MGRDLLQFYPRFTFGLTELDSGVEVVPVLIGAFGIVSYFLIEMGYPIAPLVIGVILGPMADENLRRALMVSQGSFLPVFQRPVSLILFLIIVWTVISQFPWYQTLKNRMIDGLLRRKN